MNDFIFRNPMIILCRIAGKWRVLGKVSWGKYQMIILSRIAGKGRVSGKVSWGKYPGG